MDISAEALVYMIGELYVQVRQKNERIDELEQEIQELNTERAEPNATQS